MQGVSFYHVRRRKTPLVGAGCVVLVVGISWWVRRWWIRRQNPALFREFD